ncbi:MAG: hypothetical protein EOS72_03380 [Mesorhizobium sp.]|uniref:hypothetical protein n=1 Tax=Mesorhizobium sp. TaxID=1871066 RepID=UPI000FE6A06C|nr:hypothetical protein [Mesorhizobium sp.]RWC91709.1 MAG: hypothetical protein EOS72_03380 [Mesorhizobium sp.]
MGKVKIRYYSIIKGRGYWQPTSTMRAAGFNPQSCGPDGPSAWAIAEKLNKAWDNRHAPAAEPTPVPVVETWPAGSVGEAFQVYRGTNEWAKKAVRTREDWERAWKYIGPVFGKFSPRLVSMPAVSEWRQAIEDEISLREAHRALKIWRALWKVMAALKYCEKDQDPSLAVVNTEPKGRSATWNEGEAVLLIKAAIREGYKGLAAALACMWDGAVAPVDARTLKLSQKRQDSKGIWFDITRGKTGRDGVLTLSRRTERLLNWYLAEQFGEAEPISNMEIFRTRRGAAYRKNSLSEDFRDIRKIVFPGDTRMMLDFRRSGSTEAVAGGVEGTALSAKLANSLSESKKLEQTYVPIQVEMVRRADDARREGRRALRGNKTR